MRSAAAILPALAYGPMGNRGSKAGHSIFKLMSCKGSTSPPDLPRVMAYPNIRQTRPALRPGPFTPLEFPLRLLILAALAATATLTAPAALAQQPSVADRTPNLARAYLGFD